MIPARKGGLLGWCVNRYVHAKIRSSFRAVWVRGPLSSLSRGTLLYANHPGFWDGFIVHALSTAAGWDGYCLMEEGQLARFGFLSRLGAFSIRRGDARSAVESLRYVRALLRTPTAVLVFPEGQLHSHCRPAPFERGVEVLARSSRADCLPIALRYAFFEHELPEVLVEVGLPHAPGELGVFEANLAALCAGLQRARPADGFRLLMRGRRGIAERWGARPRRGRSGVRSDSAQEFQQVEQARRQR